METIVVVKYVNGDFVPYENLTYFISLVRLVAICIPAIVLIISICILRGKIKKLSSPTISSKDALMHIHTAIFSFYIVVVTTKYILLKYSSFKWREDL